MLVTRSAGSDLIVALCKAGWASNALLVYRDMMASAWGTGTAKHAQHGPSQHQAEPPLQSPSRADSEPSSASSPSQKSRQQPHASVTHSRAEGCSDRRAGDGIPLMESLDFDIDHKHGAMSSEQGTDSPAVQLIRPVRMPLADPAPTLAAPVHQKAVVQPRESSSPENRRQGLARKAKLQQQRMSSPNRVKQKGQPILMPYIAAVGALVGALARSGDLNTALELYAQVLPSTCVFLTFKLTALPCLDDNLELILGSTSPIV